MTYTLYFMHMRIGLHACLCASFSVHPRLALNLFCSVGRLCVLSSSGMGDLQTHDTTPKDWLFVFSWRCSILRVKGVPGESLGCVQAFLGRHLAS